jgi:oleate hydratase
MYYSNGNYEAFARPRKPRGVDQKSAHLVGGGVASLAAAAFLIRDGQMDGRRITIYEATNIAGGCLDGIYDPQRGYLFRGEREMEDHYECMWDLYRSIPSLDVEDASVLDDDARRTRPTARCC